MAGLAPTAIPIPFTDFHGGLNTRDAPYLVTFNQARDLQNVQATQAGSIVKRTGLVTLASPVNVFNSLFALESVSPVVLIGADSGAIYSVSTGGTVTSLASGFSNNRWSFASAPVVSARGPLYAMNGVDTPQQWSGTGAAASWTNASGAVAVPNGKYMLYTGNQMFVAGVSAAPSTVYFSAVKDPTNWDAASLTGAGSMDFDPNDGGAITGIGTVGPYILVAKPRKLWVITNPATAAFRKISDNIGVASHRSIASGPEGTYFLAEDRGVYVTNGSKVTPLPDLITPTFNSITAGQRQFAAGVCINSHYYLSVALNGATNDTVLDFDVQLQSWWKHTFGSNQFALWHSSTGPAQLYSAKASSAIVDQCFVPGVFTDNGAAMSWAWRSSWQSPILFRHKWWNTPYYRKRLRQVRVEGFGTVDFSLATDFAGTETLIRANALAATAGGTFGASDGTVFGANDGTLFGAPSVQRARFYSLGVANAFSAVFSATSTTQDEVLSYILMLVARRDGVVL